MLFSLKPKAGETKAGAHPWASAFFHARFFLGMLSATVDQEPPEPIGRSVEYAKRRTGILHEQDAAIEAIKQRAVRVYGEMVLNEMDLLVICGWPKEKAYLPAVNNLSVRKRDIQDELIAVAGRIQKETKAKLLRLEKLFRSDNG